MADLIGQWNHWHWWILAVLFVVLEVFTPGTFFLFMGISAAVIGGVVLIVPGMGWEYQVLGFAVLAVVATVLGRSYLKRRPIHTDRPTLNRRGAQYIGRTFSLDEPIVNGQGKIRVDDSTWKISGSDCAAGSRVKVTGVDGTVLQVEVIR
ncbi:NfeD family protein [Sulfurivermis fontis]|uniref:NfeD family protein n=1 Tax=Sulfurivermis fontis TaxID=1972068 RepID=UPI000FD6DFB8|nr:NfeD family protein [Sulfurivermis fontis]